MTQFAKLALNTATLGHNLEGFGAGLNPYQVIDLCAEYGLGGVVFWRREIGNALQVSDYARSANVPISGLCRTPYLVGPDANLDDLAPSIEMAAALGAPVLTIVVGGVERATKGVAPTLDLLQQRLELALPMAKDFGVTLALEPLHPVYAGNRSALVRTHDAVDIVNKYNDDHLKIALDVYHVWWDLGLADALARARGRVAGLHLCDWLADTTDVLLDRGMMGDGIADILNITELVEATGYDGMHEVEIFSKNTWWQRKPTDVIEVIKSRFAQSQQGAKVLM